MRPFLSVVTINRNNAAGLRKTIESVLNDTNIAPEDLEYIIIDGESTDGSVDVIKEYAARTDLHHKIDYWVSEKDSGIYNAMNKGIRAAHGEYVATLNSGDYYVWDALHGLKEAAQARKGAILYGAEDFMREGKFVKVYYVTDDMLPEKMVPHQATFIPMAVYDKYGLYDESFTIAADYDFLCTLKREGVPFCRLPKIIAAFDMEGIGSVHTKTYCEEVRRVERRNGIKRGGVLHAIKVVIKLFVPYGILVALWNIKRAIIKKRKDKARIEVSAA